MQGKVTGVWVFKRLFGAESVFGSIRGSGQLDTMWISLKELKEWRLVWCSENASDTGTRGVAVRRIVE